MDFDELLGVLGVEGELANLADGFGPEIDLVLAFVLRAFQGGAVG